MTSAVTVFATAMPAAVTMIAVITTTMPASPVWVASMPAIITMPSAIASTPVISIPNITAVTDNNLVMTTTIAVIVVSVVCIAIPWITVVDYNLVSVINIVVAISYR